MMRGPVVLLRAVALAVCLCAVVVGIALFACGCRRGATRGEESRRGSPSTAPRPAKWTATSDYSRYVTHLQTLPMSALVKEIGTVGGLWQAVAATEEALARGGIGTTDLETVYVAAHSPAASFVAIPPETLWLALDARRPEGSGRLTVAQLAKMLADFGWRFRPDAPPGQQMMRALRELVTEARRDPSSPLSDLGLFLDASARIKQPAVDLGSAEADPDKIQLNLLDLQLFAAAFDRSVQFASPAKAPPTPALSALELFAPARAYAAELPTNPCSQMRDEWLGKMGSEAFGVEVRQERRVLIKKFFSAEDAKGISQALGALSIALRLQKLVAIYADTEVAVTASNTTVHKPNETTPDKYVLFTARAGVSEKDWADYEAQMGARVASAVWDCLKTLGVPSRTDLAALADEAQNWQVQWEIRPVDSPHVEIKRGGTHPADDENVFDFPGLMQNKLVRKSPSSAEAELRVVIKPEKKADHDSGIETAATVKICALVKTAARPPVSTFVTGAKLGMGLAQALVDLGAGWIQTMAPPASCAPLEVTYHVAADLEVSFRSKIGVTYVGMGGRLKGRGTFATQFKTRLAMDPATRNLIGSGQLAYYLVDYSQVLGLDKAGKCTISATGTTHGSPVTVRATRFTVPHGPGSKPDIELEIDLGYPTEDYVTRCNPAYLQPKKEPNMHWWDNGFYGSHLGEFRGKRTFLVTFDQSTTVDATPTLAGIIKKEWKRTINPAVGSQPGVQTIVYDEDTTITVVLVPRK